MKQFYAYGCVISPNLKRSRDIKNTRVYKELKTIITQYSLEIPENHIYIDIIDGKKRPRPAFEELNAVLMPQDVVLVPSLTHFGTDAGKATQNYTILLIGNNGILMPKDKDGYDFSTVDFNGESICTQQEIYTLVDNIHTYGFRTNQGTDKIGLSPSFIEMYWNFERYQIDLETACKNNYFRVSVNTFKRLCDEYEAKTDWDTGNYYHTEMIEETPTKNNQISISRIPKRHGAVPKNFDALMAMVQPQLLQTPDNANHIIYAACQALEIREMDEILYKRFVLKYIGGKTSLVNAAKKYQDEALIKKLTTSISKDKS